MKIQPISYHSRARWLRKPMLSGAYRHWLIDEGSLTKRLQMRYRDFAVRPTQVVYGPASLDEAQLLHMPTRKVALIREVDLLGGGQPVVFAHSVLPRVSLRGAWLGLSHLGSKPLGGALFSNPRVNRTPLSFKKLTTQHPLYKHAVSHLDEKPTYLWARRSVFRLHCAAILVTEIFLPKILES